MITKFEGEFEFLSNFFPIVIEYEGITYTSVEHAYQAAKTLDEDIRLSVASLISPGSAKKMGRVVQLRKDWEKIKISVMKELLLIKFSNQILSKKLSETGEQKIVEGNLWHDNFWGDCFCPQCIDIVGKNFLGQLLMQIREINKNQLY